MNTLIKVNTEWLQCQLIMEGLWSYVKEELAKHHGVSMTNFHIHLAEQEFRFNNRGRSP